MIGVSRWLSYNRIAVLRTILSASSNPVPLKLPLAHNGEGSQWSHLHLPQRGGRERAAMGTLQLARAREAGKENHALAQHCSSTPNPSIKIPSILIKTSAVENQSMHSLGAWQGALLGPGG